MSDEPNTAPSAATEAQQLAALVEQIDTRRAPVELLALATAIDELGRRVALDVARYVSQPDLAAPLKPVLLAIPRAYAQTLLRAAERYDDLGSPKRAAFALVEALRRAFEAGMVDVVGDALIFLLETNEQASSAASLRTIVTEAGETGASRREVRERYLARLDTLRASIDWNALDDEPESVG